MKKLISMMLALTLVFAIVYPCNMRASAKEKSYKEVNKTVIVNVGQTLTIPYTYATTYNNLNQPTDTKYIKASKVKWTITEGAKKIKLKKGKITGLKKGSAEIEAVYKNQRMTITVDIRPKETIEAGDVEFESQETKLVIPANYSCVDTTKKIKSFRHTKDEKSLNVYVENLAKMNPGIEDEYRSMIDCYTRHDSFEKMRSGYSSMSEMLKAVSSSDCASAVNNALLVYSSRGVNADVKALHETFTYKEGSDVCIYMAEYKISIKNVADTYIIACCIYNKFNKIRAFVTGYDQSSCEMDLSYFMSHNSIVE